MAKKAKTISSAAETDENVGAPQEAVNEGDTAGAADESVSAAIHNPESESNGTSEGSGNGAAPAPADAIEDGANTSESESGDAADAGPSVPVKPQEGLRATAAIPAEAETAPSPPEVEASTSGDSVEGSSQGAADDDGSMAGAVRALLIAAGAESVEQLLDFAELGSRVFVAFPELQSIPPLNIRFERAHGYGAAIFNLVALSAAFDFDIALGPDLSAVPVDEDGKVSHHAIRVKSSRDGFRRACMLHSRTGRTFAAGELSDEQLEALLADSSITVEYI